MSGNYAKIVICTGLLYFTMKLVALTQRTEGELGSLPKAKVALHAFAHYFLLETDVGMLPEM